VELGDRRLSRRTIEVATAMASDPQASIPMQNKLWKATKGAYRLFDHPKTTFPAMAQAHWEQTRQRAGQEGGVVLMIQDTTELDYTSHPATKGLGRFGKGPIWESGQGMLLHSVLAVRPPAGSSEAAQVLGLSWGKLWCRKKRLAVQKKKRSSRCGKRGESTRWTEAVKAIGAGPGECLWVHVGDREADIFGLYEACTRSPHLGFVIRAMQPRNALAGHSADEGPVISRKRPQQTLAQVARSLDALGESTLAVTGKAGREARQARLKIASTEVTLYSPWKRSRTANALKLWVVRVWEVDVPRGEKPIEWIILTSIAIKSLADAQRVASWYALRWMIEEYHKCLKSGCRVEERQLESAQRLKPLVAMLCVVAVRLLQLKQQSRSWPEAPALEYVPQSQVQTLVAYLRKHVDSKITVASLTIRRFTHEVAKLGGFVGRKSDGEPGWQTLWQGWRQLELMTMGRELNCGKSYG
jgi:transposase-like protein/transposase Tn5 family protein